MLPPRLYLTGQPYDVLRAGKYWFLPWMEKRPKRDLAWSLFPELWRTPAGAKWTADQVAVWAKRRGLELRRTYFVPRLIDTDAIAAEEKILYDTV